MIKIMHYLDKKMKYSKFMLLGALGVALLTATSLRHTKRRSLLSGFKQQS